MANKKCIDAIKQVKGKLTDSEVEALADALESEVTIENLSAADALLKADELTKDFLNRKRYGLMLEQRNRTINALVEKNVLEWVDNFSTQVGKDDPVMAIKAYLHGRTIAGTEGRNNIDALQQTLFKQYVGHIMSKIIGTDLEPILRKGILDKEIAIELWELSPNGTPGKSGSKQAQAIAKIVREAQEVARQRANRAGADINQVDGYVSSQTHNGTEMLKAGLDEWKAKIRDRVDVRATLRAIGAKVNKGKTLTETLDEILDEMYINHVHGRAFDADSLSAKDPISSVFKGPSNVAGRLSQHRKIIFKSAEDFYEYNREFGNGRTLSVQIISDLESMARQTGLMERLGTNPEAMMNRVRQKLANRVRKTDPKAFKELSEDVSGFLKPSIGHVMDDLTGKTRRIQNHTRAMVVSESLALQTWSKLGGSMLTSFSDVSSAVAELNWQGLPMGAATMNQFKTLTSHLSPVGERQALALVGAGFEGMLGNLSKRFNADNFEAGFLSRNLNTFFKLNGLEFWTDAQMAGVSRMMSRFIGDQAKNPFADLSPETRNALGLSGIDEIDWDVIRSNGIGQIDKQKWLLVDRLDNIGNDKLRTAVAAKQGIAEADVTNRQIATYKDEIGTKARLHLVQAAEAGVPKPGARERAFMQRGTSIDSPLGAALRYFFQFKAFSISYINRSIERETLGRVGGGSKLKALANPGSFMLLSRMIATMTMAGYFANWGKDILNGREPRDPASLQTFTDALTRGGGLSIYGDFLFNESNRYGQSFIASMGGPWVGTGEQVVGLFMNARDKALLGEGGGNLGAKATKIVQGLTPLQNLFYTKLATDTLLFNSFKEAFDPGYLRRRQRRQRKEGQEFIIPPSAAF